VDGIVVHGIHESVFLVSGDPVVVMALAESGCSVTPLDKSPAAPRFPGRQWLRVDTPDPDIAAMVAEVDWTGVSDKIQWLVDFGTRYSLASNHYTVADAIGDVFSNYGLVPVFRSFQYNEATMWNVEATQTGTVYPDSFYVICGHFDSRSGKPLVSAPGADDNGTGVATVLTAAEILTPHHFEYSIRYICFAGEEQGLRGSEAYAAWAALQNLSIIGVLNFDMMGYWTPGVPKDLEIETNVASQGLAAVIVDAANLYTGAPYELHVDDGAWWGDHASFWAEGYAAVNHEEAWDWYDPDFSPYYHSVNDLLAYVDPDFTVGNIRIGVAALATLAGYVPEGTGVDRPVTPPSLAGSLRAHPNPFGEQVTFTVSGLPDRERATVLLFDASGRRVGEVPIALSGGQGATLWNAGDGDGRSLGAGVYFAKVEGLPGTGPVKIVRVR
jgi:aminopeptidase YwaD